jgi:AraC-like DNA-binding protein
MKNRTPSLEKPDNLPQGLSFGIKTLQSVQRQENSPNEKVYCHNYYDIIWVTGGRGIHRVDLQQFDIREHRLFCVQPGEMFVMEPLSDLEGYVISFTQSFLGIDDVEFDMVYPGGIYQLFDRCKALQVQPELIADMTMITERLVKEYNNPDPFRLELLRRYFKIFLIYLSRQFEEMGRQANPIRAIGLVQKFMELLNSNFKAMRMVADYARQLSVTPNYLNESVKKATGYPASHHIRQRIALEAKRKATYSDVCMKEIAYHLGFSDSAHFSKFFKNTTGMNFTDFKRERFSPAAAPAYS